jgi:hypothetical protein
MLGWDTGMLGLKGIASFPGSLRNATAHPGEMAEIQLPTPVEWQKFNRAGGTHGITRNMRCQATL